MNRRWAKIGTVLLIGLAGILVATAPAPDVAARARLAAGGLDASPEADGAFTLRWHLGSRVPNAQFAVTDEAIVGIHDDRLLYALDPATGTVLWRTELARASFSAPAASGDAVYVIDSSETISAFETETGHRLWSHELGEGHGDALTANNEAVFAVVTSGSWLTDYTADIVALDAMTGAERWRVSVATEPIEMVVATAEMVYAPGGDGFLYALDAATGTEMWRVETRDEILEAPIVANGTVYVFSGDGNLYAVDGDTGQVQWLFATAAEIGGTVVMTDQVLILDTDENRIYGIDPESGAELWRYSSLARRSPPPTPNGNESILIETLDIGQDPQIVVLDAATGVELHRTPAARDVEGITVADGLLIGSGDHMLHGLDLVTGAVRWAFGNPIAGVSDEAGDTLYAGSHDGNLYAIDAACGQVRWRFSVGEAVGPPAVADGIVYAGSHDGVLYAVDADTGTERWRFATLAPIYEKYLSAGGPPIIVDGTVFFVSRDGWIYAVDAASGELRWKQETGAIEPALAVDDGVVIAVHVSGSKLFAFDAATGVERWRAVAGVSGAPVAGGGVVVVSGYSDRIVAFDTATGAEVWRRDSAHDRLWLATDGQTIFGVGSDEVFALDAATGRERWVVEDEVSWTDVSLAGDTVVVSTEFAEQPIIAGFDAQTGAERWRYENGELTRAESGTTGSAVAVAKKVLYAFGIGDDRCAPADDGPSATPSASAVLRSAI